ncbi:MAG TPA: RNA polymerase sigma factor [Baekduia sp.]
MAGDAEHARRAIDAVWRIESPRLIAGLARMTRDVGHAEDLAQDALVRALETWPRDGVPDNPGAWLMATAKRRAIDQFRRAANLERKQEQLAYALGAELALARDDVAAAAADEIGDDLLALMFTCCHPVLGADARIALTLRMLGGLRTDEIARAFLVGEATIQQRVVRAKRTLAESGAGFRVPEGDELPERLASVLEVVYLIFNEGYAATAGDDWLRPDLCFDALRLARTLAALAPREPEAHGLLSLLEIQASRIGARTTADGTPILLLDQDRTRWNRLLTGRGLASLDRALALPKPAGAYTLQAAIAACHARAGRPEDTDWVKIAALYAALAHIAPSPILEVNRAVAIGFAFGPAAGLDVLDDALAGGRLDAYHLAFSVRGDLLARLGGRGVEAHEAFTRAARLTRNERERTLLLARAAAVAT